MRLNYPLLVLFVAALNTVFFASSGLEKNLSKIAVTGDTASSQAAILELRSLGQKGLDAFFETYRNEIREYKKGGTPAEWTQISTAMDAVAKQKDSYSARLLWHTDLNSARAAAHATGKPILSLRLLGRLDEEYSCANSRFFRSLLYSDPAIAATLRKKYILHWKSVRPAPKITIDFGDGRKLVRTITGNSIHYVLDRRGRILDALPGLYSPKLFKNYLEQLAKLEKKGYSNPGLVRDYRLAKTDSIIKDWNKRLELLGKSGTLAPIPDDNRRDPTMVNPTALDAAPLAVTKLAVERPAVLALMPQIEKLRNRTGINDWEKLSRLGPKIEFSDQSLRLVRRKSGITSNSEFSKLVVNLKKYVGIDTVQNEFRFHPKLMSWLAPMSSSNVERFNQRVYSQLFLTPDSDKWLGLYAPDIYSAIENNGVIKN